MTALELDMAEMLLSHRIPLTSIYGHDLKNGAAADWPTVFAAGVAGLKGSAATT